ncbi:hypothetical protein AX774_g3341 [Zancudomyces culisetae]|uniref:Uncharacterized protein n=1 Tax=Zancudomyces culisetae TaxID=1213189 RepID=A0A1R1PQ84_ZANCU|nr:hypothetical protein AX774_g3341 [Zancudomyces culisetae]|eukprot:OMH83145.1 hypothetical protein AX774_g3341 [Zancudomyces culisetae]
MPAAHKKGSEYSDDDYRIKSDQLESVGVAEELKPKDDNSTSTIKRGFAGNEVEKSNFAGTHQLENLQQNVCIIFIISFIFIKVYPNNNGLFKI